MRKGTTNFKFVEDNIFYEDDIKFSKTKNKFIERRLMQIFLTVGIPANLQGYYYLKDCIKLAMKDPVYLANISKKMYPKIASKYSTTPSRVERGVRNALDVAYCRGKIIHLNEIFGFDVLNKLEKPTNAEFMALIADKLNLEYR